MWPGAAQPWPGLVDLARQADAGFWHCVYMFDHFMPSGYLPEDETGMLEATGALAALAGSTTRVRLAPLVLSMTYRHPAVLANWAATVDHISDGRLTLGLGAGWQVNEHEHYGLELGRPGERVDRFAEGLTVIRGLLNQPRTTLPPSFNCAMIPVARLTGMAKPMPWPLATMAVLIPTTSPLRFTSGPPLFPGLMDASVWIKSS